MSRPSTCLTFQGFTYSLSFAEDGVCVSHTPCALGVDVRFLQNEEILTLYCCQAGNVAFHLDTRVECIFVVRVRVPGLSPLRFFF